MNKNYSYDLQRLEFLRGGWDLNPQTTIALTFLTHIISGIDGVPY